MARRPHLLSRLRGQGPGPLTTAVPGRRSLTGAAAPPVVGVTLAGEEVELRAEGLVLFMTSSCLACQELWSALAAGAGSALPGRPAVVVVTPDPTLEDRRRVAALAPAALAVVMSTAAWQAYRAGPAPWVAVIADRRVVGEGPAAGWPDVVALAGTHGRKGRPPEVE